MTVVLLLLCNIYFFPIGAVYQDGKKWQNEEINECLVLFLSCVFCFNDVDLIFPTFDIKLEEMAWDKIGFCEDLWTDYMIVEIR
jgi:hypothetical protein